MTARWVNFCTCPPNTKIVHRSFTWVQSRQSWHTFLFQSCILAADSGSREGQVKCTFQDEGEGKVKVLATESCLILCDPVDIACQALLSMGFSRQEYRSGLPCPSPGDLPDLGIEPEYPTLQADSLLSEPPGKPWGRMEGACNCLAQVHPSQVNRWSCLLDDLLQQSSILRQNPSYNYSPFTQGGMLWKIKSSSSIFISPSLPFTLRVKWKRWVIYRDIFYHSLLIDCFWVSICKKNLKFMDWNWENAYHLQKTYNWNSRKYEKL